MKKLVLLTTLSISCFSLIRINAQIPPPPKRLTIIPDTTVSYPVTLDYNNTYYTSPYVKEKEKPYRRFMVTIRVDGKTKVNYQPVEEILPKEFSVKNDIAIDVIGLRRLRRPRNSGSKITYDQQLVNNKKFLIKKDKSITIAFGPGKKINFYEGTINLHVLIRRKAPPIIKQNDKNINLPPNLSTIHSFFGGGGLFNVGEVDAFYYAFKNIKPGPVEVTIKHKGNSGGKIFNSRSDFGIYIRNITSTEAVASKYQPGSFHDRDWTSFDPDQILSEKKYKIPLRSSRRFR